MNQAIVANNFDCFDSRPPKTNASNTLNASEDQTKALLQRQWNQLARPPVHPEGGPESAFIEH